MLKGNIIVFSPKNLNELLSLYSSNTDADIFAGALEFMNYRSEKEIKEEKWDWAMKEAWEEVEELLGENSEGILDKTLRI